MFNGLTRDFSALGINADGSLTTALDNALGSKVKSAKLDAENVKHIKEHHQKRPLGKQPPLVLNPLPPPTNTAQCMTSAMLTLDDEQTAAMTLAIAGASFVMIGAAGCGKTTTTSRVVYEIAGTKERILYRPSSYYTGLGIPCDHKYLDDTMLGVLVVSFTNKAVNNLANALPTHYDPTTRRDATAATSKSYNLTHNCRTIHKVLMFAPEESSRLDLESGEDIIVKVYRPQRDATRKLPPEITTCILEESSMIEIGLAVQLFSALPDGCQIIMLGDLNQLQPVGGYPILGAGVITFPVVQLTHIYRHGGPVQDFAHQVRKGETAYLPFKSSGHLTSTEESSVLVTTYADSETSPEFASSYVHKLLTSMYSRGAYTPGVDAVLMYQRPGPVGLHAMSDAMDCHIDSVTGRLTYYIHSRGLRQVRAVGDVVLIDKRQWMVVGIEPNPEATVPVYSAASFNTRDPLMWLEAEEYWSKSDYADVLSGKAGSEGFVDSLMMSVDGMFNATKLDTRKGVIDLSKTTTSGKKRRIVASHIMTFVALDTLPRLARSAGYEGKAIMVHNDNLVRELAHRAIELDASYHVNQFGRVASDDINGMFDEYSDEGDEATLSPHGAAVKAMVKDVLKKYNAETLLEDGGLQRTNSSDWLSSIEPGFLTIHASQGSQFRRVIFVTHDSHDCWRELLYTGVTRAVYSLIVICDGTIFGAPPKDLFGVGRDATKKFADSFPSYARNSPRRRGVQTQRIQGVTLEEKVGSFLKNLAMQAHRSASNTDADVSNINFFDVVRRNLDGIFKTQTEINDSIDLTKRYMYRPSK